jgi:hypothetical protein
MHARSLHLRAVDHPRRGVRRLRHRAGAGAARRRTHPVTTNVIAGLEDATAAARQRVADESAHHHVAIVPVGALTTAVADAV